MSSACSTWYFEVWQNNWFSGLVIIQCSLALLGDIDESNPDALWSPVFAISRLLDHLSSDPINQIILDSSIDWCECIRTDHFCKSNWRQEKTKKPVLSQAVIYQENFEFFGLLYKCTWAKVTKIETEMVCWNVEEKDRNRESWIWKGEQRLKLNALKDNERDVVAVKSVWDGTIRELLRPWWQNHRESTKANFGRPNRTGINWVQWRFFLE